MDSYQNVGKYREGTEDNPWRKFMFYISMLEQNWLQKVHWFFFRPRDAFKYEVSGIDVGEITEVKIKSERKIRTETGWELRKVP